MITKNGKHFGRPKNTNEIPRPEGSKVCAVCCVKKPLSEFFLRLNRKPWSKCKECRYIYISIPKNDRAALEARFWPKVANVNDLNDCWEWIASKDADGYGNFSLRSDGKEIKGAHRIAWILTFGPIPSGLLVCHGCDNPSCVNPSHLFLGTNTDNMRDAAVKGRMRNNNGRGEKNHMARLTWEAVEQGRAWLRAGITRSEVAKRLRVSPTTVYAFATGTTWRPEDRP